MLADVRRVFEQRATALLHDTVLNQLAVMTTAQGPLSSAVRASICADLETIVNQEWFCARRGGWRPGRARLPRRRVV